MFSLTCLALIASSLSSTPAEPPVIVATGQIGFTEPIWGRGRFPTLSFGVTGGRGPAPFKVLAYLYISDFPDAFTTTTYAPQFVGVLQAPSSVEVVVQRPERGPINAYSREKFVQGALFDPTTGALLDVTNQAYLDIAYDSSPVGFQLDFQTEDDFTTPLVNGQSLSTPPEFGRLVSLSSQQPTVGAPHHGLAIFDSSPGGPNASSSDPDLLVNLGNVLILQENGGQTVPGIFNLPDDSASGGTMVFEFSGFDFIEKVEPRSIDLIDVDFAGAGARVTLIDVLGHTRTFSVPTNWTGDIHSDGPPGYRTLDLTTLDPQPGFASTATAKGDFDFIPGEVVRMEVELKGSGAVDNLVFVREQDPGALSVSRHKIGSARDPGAIRSR